MSTGSSKLRSHRLTLTNLAAYTLGIVAAAVVAHYFAKNWGGRMSLAEPFPYANPRMADFKDAMYLPARDFLYTHIDPYDWHEFIAAHVNTEGYSPYTPSHLWVAALFAWMDWPIATAAWSGLVAVSISVMGAIGGDRALRAARPDASREERFIVAAAAVTGVWIWRPTYDAAVFGQPSGFYGPVAAIVSLTVLAIDAQPRPRSDVVTGLWTAVALCKPQVGLKLVLAECVARRWRALAIGISTTAVLSVLAVARLAGGVTRVPSWLIHLPGQVTSAPSRLDPRYGSGWVDVSADLHNVGLDRGAFGALGPLLAVIVLVAGLWAIGLSRRAHRPWLGALTLTLAELAALPDYRYDLLVLYPMLLMAAAEAWTHRGTTGTTVTTLLLLTVTVSGLIPNQVVSFGTSGGAVSGAILLVGLAFAIYAVVLCSRPSPTTLTPAAV